MKIILYIYIKEYHYLEVLYKMFSDSSEGDIFFIVMMTAALLIMFGILGFGLYHTLCTDDVHHYYKVVDKRIEGAYASYYIIVTENGQYNVMPRDYLNTNVNDTIDIVTDKDGYYKSYNILK